MSISKLSVCLKRALLRALAVWRRPKRYALLGLVVWAVGALGTWGGWTPSQAAYVASPGTTAAPAPPYPEEHFWLSPPFYRLRPQTQTLMEYRAVGSSHKHWTYKKGADQPPQPLPPVWPPPVMRVIR